MEEALSARFYAAKQPLKLETVQISAMGDDQVLVDVKAASICHSDLHTIAGRQVPATTPITLGHEASGVVAAKGKDVTGIEVGDRVGVDYVHSCGRCQYCLKGKDNLCDNFTVMSFNTPGSWAEKVVVPGRHVHRLPANVGFPEGAMLNCAVMTAYHAVKYAQMMPGASVVVYGLGGVGLSLLKWTKIAGATDIIAVDLEEEKLKVARREGATATVNPREGNPVEQIRKLTNGGVDIGFEVIGKTESEKNVVASVKKGGQAVLVGMCWDPLPVHVVNDLQVPEVKIMSPQDHLKSEIPEVLRLIETGRFVFGDAVTHKFPLESANEAVGILQNRVGNPGRVVLEP
jgi:2-desacetyl-2-hydroxyethyl bacteriochlorophyllide A dehydrogenase